MKSQYVAALQRMTHAGSMNLDCSWLYQVARLWRQMVTAYTDLLLTRSRDKLPALGGLARQMSITRGSRYLAVYGKIHLMTTSFGMELHILGLIPERHLRGHGQCRQGCFLLRSRWSF